LPGSIYRVRGVLYAADAPTKRAVLHAVGRRVDVSLHEEWDERAPLTGSSPSVSSFEQGSGYQQNSSLVPSPPQHKFSILVIIGQSNHEQGRER
jgi:hypothetical protein